MHTIQCSSAVFRPQNNLKLCFHAGLKAKRQTCACVSTNVLTSKLQLYEMHTMFPLGLFVLFWVVLFFLPMRPSSISHFLFFLNFLFISASFIIGSVVFTAGHGLGCKTTVVFPLKMHQRNSLVITNNHTIHNCFISFIISDNDFPE